MATEPIFKAKSGASLGHGLKDLTNRVLGQNMAIRLLKWNQQGVELDEQP